MDPGEALARLSERAPTEDVRFFCTAVAIQRSSAGNLAEILDRLSEVIRERFKILSHARALSAQPRWSASAWGWARGLRVMFELLSPGYFAPMMESPLAPLLLGAGFIMEAIGFFMVWRIARSRCEAAMNPLAYAVVTFVVVLGVTLVSALLVMRFWPAIRRERLAPAPAADASVSILRFESESESGLQRTIEKIGRSVVPKDTARLTRYRTRLAQAGFHDPRGITILWGAKLACALVGLFAYPFFGFLVQRVLSNMLIVSLGLFAFGFLLPDFWLYNRIKERQRAILNMLPDVLDLLMVCVEAGLGFDAGRGPRSRAGGSDAQPASPGADAHAPGIFGGTPARGGHALCWASAAASRK